MLKNISLTTRGFIVAVLALSIPSSYAGTSLTPIKTTCRFEDGSTLQTTNARYLTTSYIAALKADLVDGTFKLSMKDNAPTLTVSYASYGAAPGAGTFRLAGYFKDGSQGLSRAQLTFHTGRDPNLGEWNAFLEGGEKPLRGLCQNTFGSGPAIDEATAARLSTQIKQKRTSVYNSLIAQLLKKLQAHYQVNAVSQLQCDLARPQAYIGGSFNLYFTKPTSTAFRLISVKLKSEPKFNQTGVVTISTPLKLIDVLFENGEVHPRRSGDKKINDLGLDLFPWLSAALSDAGPDNGYVTFSFYQNNPGREPRSFLPVDKDVSCHVVK